MPSIKSLLPLLSLMMLFAWCSPASARMPQLIYVPPGDDTAPAKIQEELRLSRVSTEVRIHGWLAETRTTMTFANPTGRNLAGDLYFPLPEGATVSGYALDINGVMVDGVVVEKDKGRQVFEKEVRKGVDPGLVEWVKGNNFKTRVFPIPPHGSRTIMVRYISGLVDDKGTPAYHLPLHFSKKVDELRVRIEVVKSENVPVIASGALPGLSFGKWRDGFVAETTVKEVAPAQNLIISIPDLDKHRVVLEKAADGATWFTIHDLPVIPPPRPASAPTRVGVIWDASASRGDASHERELEALRRFFTRFPNAEIEVELTVIRNDVGKPQRFTVKTGDATSLVNELKRIPYDGGTRMSAIAPSAGTKLPDYYLLFTDGISNFGAEEPGSLPRPLYIFSDDARANHPFLRYLAMKSGGEYYNLAAIAPATAALSAGAPGFSFISATFDNKAVTDITPGIPQPVHGRFSLSGRLLGSRAAIVLNYGIAGSVTYRAEYLLDASGATPGELAATTWGMKRLEELLILPKRNREAITATGKRFGLVTPGTSLLVLENFNQYLEHRVEPPASLPEMRRKYRDHLASMGMEEERKKEDKLQYVLALWRKRVGWWEKTFDYPPGFRFEQQIKRETGGVMTEPGDRAPMPPPMAAPAPAPAEDRVMMERAEIPEASHRDTRFKAAKKSRNGAMSGREDDGETDRPKATISIAPWNPDTPYLKQLKAAEPNRRYGLYLELRKSYGNAPAFFLDCADFFMGQKDSATAMRILSNIAEMELENPALPRILAHRLEQMNHLDLAVMMFDEVRAMRPEEPQSHRDLALALARRAETTNDRKQALADYRRAIELLYHVVMNQWDRFAEIEVIALMELNRIIPKAKQAGIEGIPVDPRLVKPLGVDMRIVLTWDADMTDLDLWVIEPSGEKCFYSHPLTTIGGSMSHDITVGYGPEEYILKNGMEGIYRIEANYYGSRSAELAGTATLQAVVFTNYGRPNEERRAITLRLSRNKEIVRIGEIEFRK